MSITQIRLPAKQKCNFVWVRHGTIPADEMESILDINFSDADAGRDESTLLFAKFNNSLEAGNYDAGGVTILKWDIYKQKVGATNLQFVGSVDSSQEQIVDCLVENNQQYYYYLFPQSASAMGSPIVSEAIASTVWNWVLFTATESDTANVLNVTNSYVFQGNVDTGSISNNADSSVLKNFTRYPKIIKGTQNYRSGRLSALVGYIDTAGNTYTESSALRDAIFALSTNDERMFLKSRAGDIWEVSIHSTISMDVTDKSPYQPHTASIDWTEIGSTSGLSLVGESGA